MRQTRIALAGIAIMIATAACAGPISSATVPPSATAPVPAATLEPSLAVAMAWRQSLGLRADVDFVRAVNADPTAVTRSRVGSYEFPLTAAEAILVDQRLTNMRDVGATIVAYGEAHPDSWAGLIGDSSTGSVTGQFSGDLEIHRRAIAALLMPGARYTLTQVHWSIRDLAMVVDRVKAEKAWFADHDLLVEGYGVDQRNNVVLIDVLSENPSAAQVVADHFGTDGSVRVRVSDLLPWPGRWGTVYVKVQTKDGSKVPVGLWCKSSSKARYTYPQGAPFHSGNMCAMLIEATGQTIAIVRDPDSSEVPLASRLIKVKPDREMTITMTIK